MRHTGDNAVYTDEVRRFATSVSKPAKRYRASTREIGV